MTIFFTACYQALLVFVVLFGINSFCASTVQNFIGVGDWFWYLWMAPSAVLFWAPIARDRFVKKYAKPNWVFGKAPEGDVEVEAKEKEEVKYEVAESVLSFSWNACRENLEKVAAFAVRAARKLAIVVDRKVNGSPRPEETFFDAEVVETKAEQRWGDAVAKAEELEALEDLVGRKTKGRGRRERGSNKPVSRRKRRKARKAKQNGYEVLSDMPQLSPEDSSDC